MWPLLGTHTINSLFLFFGIYLTLLCITVVYIPLSCMLLCHKLFNAHTHVLILSYASLHLPIAGIQEKHNEYMNDWETKKKRREGKRKATRKGGKETRKITELRKLLWVPTSCFCFLMYIANWPLETQTYHYTFKENYSREKGLQKFLTQAYETQK